VAEGDLLQENVNLFKRVNDLTNEMSKDFETTISKVCSLILFETSSALSNPNMK